ncbi:MULTISPECIES: type I glyceraldehyde-3-phosphate dehydrogenase [Halomonas]|uniref:type I glyceraldehyde-3-phosphate dehydrogenase n=1 Tax=Halomonas TaxID=2745 RepID=UPI001A8C29B7|nr:MULTISPECIES: glyceraldehyde 3-phosphate dehydrogenase NAD-binding domain-containing protein [Halomonas]MED5297062.1 glyceraldehyde 3-phosphate dehydrogenase NAD-binding domain-containing protein [Pseudomonadota bacterium]MBN8413064.1 erythrose-4-phosphate dehydrogenase [Halomonas litopenaei]MBY5925360.1 erythrose-4-phosphate dehydrogenase [Halomonas sp. DP4Y7-2]MBY5968268.1 erythrose-4-phosphate dehydrogenase [Halomonas denitrificans]MBY5983760.1 erythrose-4-phosphate dehydrogenase [Halomo
MAQRIAINGYGRIGQCVLRALIERNDPSLEVVAINELSGLDTITYLTRYDTTHGRFPGSVESRDGHLLINGHPIRVLSEAEPDRLPWKALDIDLVLECSGSFKDRATAERHLAAGARRLLFSQPAESDVDATIVTGINDSDLTASARVISAASCTTNCLVPILTILDEALGIEHGVTTTIHSAMNDQPVIDAYHQTDLRLTRSAMQSIVPVDTGLARGINRLMPHLAERFECLHVRVPTINVSAMDLSICVQRDTSAQAVNRLLQEASNSRLAGLLGYTEEPMASIDFNHDPRSGIVDATQTRVAGGRLLKLLCWFDNEWGFANRMLDVATRLNQLPRALP